MSDAVPLATNGRRSSILGAIVAFAVVGLLSGGLFVWLLFARATPALAPGMNLPKEYAALPDFRLVERSGRAVTRDDLLGEVCVCGFIFTRCHETCPMVTGVMARLRSELPKSVRVVTISVDPRYDVPEVLKIYASNFNADPDRWWFLTGDRDAVYSLIRDGFRLPVEENPDPQRLPGELVSHTTRLAVVDKRGRIRGYFDARDPTIFETMPMRARALEEESD